MTTDPNALAGRLEGCPFCGGTDIEIDKAGSDSHYFVRCNDCDVSQDYDCGYSKAEAITAWNTRQAATALQSAGAVREEIEQETLERAAQRVEEMADRLHRIADEAMNAPDASVEVSVPIGVNNAVREIRALSNGGRE